MTGLASPIDIAASDHVASDQEHSRSTQPLRRDALIYGVGIVMRRAASLIMLPIYTSC